MDEGTPRLLLEGRPAIGLAELHPVDLVVCGSGAGNRQGARVGKGGRW